MAARAWALSTQLSSSLHRLAHRVSSSAPRLIPTAAPWRPLTLGDSIRALSRGRPQTNHCRTIAAAASATETMIPQVPREPLTMPAVSVSVTEPAAWSGDLLVLGVYEEALEIKDDCVSIKSAALSALNEKLNGVITDIIELSEFKAKPGSSGTLRAGGGGTKFVQLVGLGPTDKAKPVAEWGMSVYQTMGAQVASAAKAHKAVSVGVALVDAPTMDAAATEAVASKVTLGTLLGGYEATRFKSKPKEGKLQQLQLLGLEQQAAQAGGESGDALARGVLLARYLVEAPPNICNPTYMADTARAIADAQQGVMSCRVLDYEDCKAMGMGCYLAVAEASYPEEPPAFIHLTYRPKGEVKKKVAIIGKGLTFDSGGYNLKAGAGSMIEMMKFDMGGAGATLGAAKAISLLQPPGVEVHFIIASCDNMVDGRGMRPGDVLKAANGKTVEVLNTDAEGRLTMADALWYAETKVGVDACIDIATLTGAMMISLGQGIAGFFTNNDTMADRLAAAGRESGEKVWRLPLEESYTEVLKSGIADLKNLGNRYGGAITAALFLKEFISTDKIEWAHIDIAGTAWDDKAGGATGYGAMLLTNWASEYGKE